MSAGCNERIPKSLVAHIEWTSIRPTPRRRMDLAENDNSGTTTNFIEQQIRKNTNVLFIKEAMTTRIKGVQQAMTESTAGTSELKDMTRGLHKKGEALYAFDCFLKANTGSMIAGQLLISQNILQFQCKNSFDKENIVLALDAITDVKSLRDSEVNADQKNLLISGYKNDDKDVLDLYITFDRSTTEDIGNVIEKVSQIVHNAKNQNHMSHFSSEKPLSNDRQPTKQSEYSTPDIVCAEKFDKPEVTDTPSPRLRQISTQDNVLKPNLDAVPSDITIPKAPVDCNCDNHLERQDAQLYLPISAKQCFDLMFSDKYTASPNNDSVWEDKTAAIDGHDLYVSKWETVEESRMQRILKYWMPVTNPIVRMKEAEVVETQVLINKEDYIRYSVQISTKTAALPYAEAFIPSVRYCITWVSEAECKLTCYLGVRWVKNVLVKAIVTRAALKGMSESVHVFMPILKKAAERLGESADKVRLQHLPVKEDPHDRSLAKGSSNPTHMDTLKREEYANSSMKYKDDPESNAQLEKIESASCNHGISNEGLLTQTGTALTNNRPHLNVTEQVSPTISEQRSVTGKHVNLLDDNRCTDSISNTSTVSKRIDSSRKISPQARPNGLPKKKTSMPSKPNDLFATRHTYNPSLIQLLFVLGLIVLTSYLTSLWTKAGPIATETSAMKHLSLTRMLGQQVRECYSKLSYLQNLNGSATNKDDNRQPYIDSISYKHFAQSQKVQKSTVAEDDTKSSTSRPSFEWYYDAHHNLAVEIGAKREAIAMLRYNALALLRTLNNLDMELHESEYMNWLLDMRSQCRQSSFENNVQLGDFNVLCQDVHQQIETIFEI